MPLKMTKVQAIRTFFGKEKPVTTEELKLLTQKERESLAQMAAEALGVELEAAA